ncbi:MAG: phosphatase PAP2 family protein [Bacteroidales bacterium]
MNSKKAMLIGIVVFIIIAILFVVPGISIFQKWDIQLLKLVNSSRTPGMTEFLTSFTTTFKTVPTVVALICIFYGFIFRKSRLVAKGAILMTTFTSALFFKDILKLIFTRPRPFVTYDFINNLAAPTNFSFPSGHTTSAFAAAFIFSFLFPRQKILCGLFFIWAIIVAYSRPYMGVHYFTDVLGGIFYVLFYSGLIYYGCSKTILKKAKS